MNPGATEQDFTGKRILITGATGFIGGRIVEKLAVEYGANVRVLLRNFVTAFRIARCPIETVAGSITNAGDVARAINGCEAVIHCAYGNSGSSESQRLVNVEGTRNVLEAARQAGCKRVVHLSTVQVYGPLSGGDLDETAPLRYFGDVYSDSKLDAETLVMEYFQKYQLPVTVIQPTVVYGPFATTWTGFVLESLKTAKQILVNGGDGLCNAIYIDDLVDAILLATLREEAIGERFLISGEQPVAWREFYGAYEQMLGEPATVNMSPEEAQATMPRKVRPRGLLKESLSILREQTDLRQRILNTREAAFLYRTVNSILPTGVWKSLRRRLMPTSKNGHNAGKPVRSLFYPLDVAFYSSKTRVRIDKAKRLLGYQPRFDLKSGMVVTEEWCRWASLLERS